MPRPITPLLTVDIIIELVDRLGKPIILIDRRYPPLGWALPGGFVDINEKTEQAAVREAAEETRLEVSLKAFLGVYSDPRRDPRGHTVTLTYIAEASGNPQANDDAKALAITAIDQIPSALLFDHNKILADYLAWRQQHRSACPVD